MIEQMKNIKSKVLKLLQENENLRDSDSTLIATFWWQELPKEIRKKITAFDFFNKFSSGQYSSPESIIRIRRKIQEQHPELRGKSYKERKIKQVETRQLIHTV